MVYPGGNPHIASPVSGPAFPYDQPSAPISGQIFRPAPPMMGVPGPAAGGSGGRGVTIVLAITTALFFILSIAMAGMFMVTRGDLEDSKNTISSRNNTISDNNTKISDLDSRVQTLEDELEQTQTDLTGSENQADELKRQKQVISDCLTLLAESSVAAEAGDTVTAQSKSDEADPVCEEAEEYLDY